MLCTNCGAQNTVEATVCGSCGSPMPTERKPAEAKPDSSPSGLRLGGTADRVLAAVLDGFLAACPFAWIGMWAADRWGGVTSNGFELHGMAAIITLLLVVVLWFLYFWLMEGFFGATLGKFILNLRVRRVDGNSMGLGKSFLRNLARFVDGIGAYLVGFLVMISSRRKQRLGDLLAGTLVVEGKSGQAPRVVASAAWGALVVACLLAAYLLHPAQGAASEPGAIQMASLGSRPTPSAEEATGQIAEAEMGTDRTADFQIVNPGTEFRPDTPKIVCVWKTSGVDPNVPVKSVWIADDVGPAAPPHYKIAEKSARGFSQGSFSLTSPNSGWPPGEYHLEIYIGDNLAKQIRFTIRPK